MVLANADYFVYCEPMPLSVRGLVTPNDDGTYSIYLNSRLDDSQKLLTYLHEVRHIENDDFYNGQPLQIIEGL